MSHLAYHYPHVVSAPAIPIDPSITPFLPQQPNTAKPPPVNTHLFMTDEIVEVEELPDLDVSQDTQATSWIRGTTCPSQITVVSLIGLLLVVTAFVVKLTINERLVQ